MSTGACGLFAGARRPTTDGHRGFGVDPSVDVLIKAPVSTVHAELVLAALAERGEAAVVLSPSGEVLAENAQAGSLGDRKALASLAVRTLVAPELLRLTDGRTLEVRATSLGERTVLLGRDVTEREAARRELSRSDQILKMGSHALRNPLHVIGMICHLLENRAAREGTIDHATIDRLRRQTDRLNRLITQLLELSRAQENRMALDAIAGDLAEIVRDEMAQLPAGRARDVHAVVADKAPVVADRARLGEVVHQLLDNAILFTDTGARIEVTLAEDPEDREAWRFTVADHGAGIPVEDRGALFLRTARQDTRRNPQGLGLGLYIAAHVAKLHGGALTFEPTSPTGATFHLRVPKQR